MKYCAAENASFDGNFGTVRRTVSGRSSSSTWKHENDAGAWPCEKGEGTSPLQVEGSKDGKPYTFATPEVIIMTALRKRRS